MATVTLLLALAAGPGFPEGSPEHRYEVALALDATGRPDAAAWLTDPQPWPARRLEPGRAPLSGDVQHDPDHGWSVRLFGAASDGPDAPEIRLDFGADPVRPGGHVTVTEPDGTASSYRVVGIA